MTKQTEITIGVAVALVVVTLGGIYLFNRNSENSSGKPTCNNPSIKGNISFRTGTKIYHLPSDRYYNETQIDMNAGERMFCTEQEARDAGWRHAQSD
jgi:hypothetical protein